MTSKQTFFSLVTRKIWQLNRHLKFPGSSAYWESRYSKGGTSGPGSYRHLAQYKAEILNSFVAKNHIGSVIEFGCGDGNQLSLARYQRYIGLDVSRKAISLCLERFAGDESKDFFLYDSLAFRDQSGIFCAELSLSLDVVYHLVEKEVFLSYMTHLFKSASRFVIIYSTNHDEQGRTTAPHVRHWQFTDWVAKQAPQWTLLKKIDNPYEYNIKDSKNTTFSDFFIFQKRK